MFYLRVNKKRLDQQSPGQSYANLFRLALGYDAQNPEVNKPAHLPRYGALRDRKALCDIAIDRIPDFADKPQQVQEVQDSPVLHAQRRCEY